MSGGAAAPEPAASPLGVVMLLRQNGLGGTQRQALRLSAELTSRGVQPVVLSRRDDGLPRHEVVDGVEVRRVGWLVTRGRLTPLAFLAGALVWLARHRHRFQVIHAHNLPAALTGALVGPLLGKAVIVKLPNAVSIEAFRHRWLGRLRWIVLRRGITRFVALNDEIEARLRARGVPAGRIVRIPNGVDVDGAGPADAARLRQALGLEPGAPVVIYLGRLIADKGLAWLLGVWRDVTRDVLAARLLLVGDGPEGPRLRALAGDLGIAATVSFLGYRPDVDALLSVAGVLVLPSRSEGMSNAVLEAMAHGLAVVATDVAGNRAVVAHEEDGLLVPYDDHPALAAALRRLLGDPALRARLGRAAARKAEAAFSIGAVAAAYDGLYRELVAGRAPGPRRGHRAAPSTAGAGR